MDQEWISMVMGTGPPLTMAGVMTFVWGRSPNEMNSRYIHKKAFVKGQYVRWKISPEELEHLLHPKLISPDGSMLLTITIYFRLGCAQAAAQ